MSSLAVMVNAFKGHAVHESASEKATNGLDKNVPGEQHPKRPPPKSLFGLFKFKDKDSHLPPHNVRVKPLFRNTLK